MCVTTERSVVPISVTVMRKLLLTGKIRSLKVEGVELLKLHVYKNDCEWRRVRIIVTINGEITGNR